MREGLEGLMASDAPERDGQLCEPDASGSLTFSLRTALGRVLVCVPNELLMLSFGAAGGADEKFATFAQHIDLLNAAAQIRLEAMDNLPEEIVLQEPDVAEAQKRRILLARRNLQ